MRFFLKLCYRRLVGKDVSDDTTLAFGSYPIKGKAPYNSVIPAEKLYHYGVHYRAKRYEITGDTEPEANLVSISFGSLSSFKDDFPTVKMYKVKFVEEEVIHTFIKRWESEHQNYSYYKASCRDFVRDFMNDVFEIKIRTQSDLITEWANFVLKVGLYCLSAFFILLLAYIILLVLAVRAEGTL